LNGEDKTELTTFSKYLLKE